MATAQERKKSKKSAEPEEPVPAPPVQVEEEKTVDRIRDIIFGPQMRDYEERFQALERQLRREVTDLSEEMTRRFVALEGQLKDEVKNLGGQLQNEHAGRNKATQQLSDTIAETRRSLEAQFKEQGHALVKYLEQLEKKVDARTEALENALDKKATEIQQLLKKEVSSLRHDKTDRAALAELLVQLAGQLKK